MSISSVNNTSQSTALILPEEGRVQTRSGKESRAADTTGATGSGINGTGGASLPLSQSTTVAISVNVNVNVSTTPTSEDIARMEQAIARLAQLLSSGGLDDIGRLIIEANNAGYQAERLTTRANAATAESLLHQQAGKMRDAADKLMKGALAALITGIVAASIQIVGAVATIASAGSSLKASGGAGGAGAGAGAGGAASAQATASNTRGQGYATGAAGVAGLVSAIGQYVEKKEGAEAKRDEAEGADFAAKAARANAAKDDQGAIVQALIQALATVLQTIKEVQEAKVDALASITRKG